MERGGSVAWSSAASSRRSRSAAASSRAGARTSSTARSCSCRNARPATCSSAPARPASPAPTSTPRSGSPAPTAWGRAPSAASWSSRSCTPTVNPQVDPKDGEKRLPLMPAKLVEGDDARDVAAYVAQAVAKQGDDPAAWPPSAPARPRAPPRPRTACWTSRSPPPASPTSSPTPKAPAGEVRVTSENPQRVAAQHRGRGQRRQREGRGRPGRRHVGVLSRPAARRVHVLLLRARPPRGWHGRQAHRRVGTKQQAPRKEECLGCAAARGDRSFERCRPRERQLRAWFGPRVQGRSRRWAVRRRFFGSRVIGPDRFSVGCGRRCVVAVELACPRPPDRGGCSAAFSRATGGVRHPPPEALHRCLLFKPRCVRAFSGAASATSSPSRPSRASAARETVCERREPRERAPRREGLTVTVPDFPAATR